VEVPVDEVVAVVIFVVSLGLVFAEWVHRAVAAVAGAMVMLVAGLVLGFYSEAQALRAIDFSTIGLLLGMMILVALLEPTGFFKYVALRTAQLSHGRPYLLFLLLGGVTTVLSMFLDNVTTIVVIAPATLVIARVLGVSAAPLLMAEAMLSNVGGVATLIGDPPNILIASAAGLTFVDFLTHALPVVALAWVGATALLLWRLRDRLDGSPGADRDVAGLRARDALERPGEAWTLLLVLVFAGVLFLLQGPLGVSAAVIAVGAAGLAMVLVRPDLEKTLRHVEWSVLIFFSALFVLVGGLEAAGVLEQLAHALRSLGSVHPALLGVIVIWSVALLSAVVDNVPMTIAVIPVVTGLGAAGVDVEPLWWALAFGAGLGGNGTVVGATANIVSVTHAERAGTPISPVAWVRQGLPVLLLTCTIASIAYVLLVTIVW
jgi:Na+/H+ antiporter NhaD/arsenite permease-like protein